MSYSEHIDSTTIMRNAGDGQGEVTSGGQSLLSFWACVVCGLPTGGRNRNCSHHPKARLFLRHVKSECP